MSIMSCEIRDDPEEGGKMNNMENSAGESCFLIRQLDRDTSIDCLLRLSRSDYGSIAALNRNFRSLIKTGGLYQLRQKRGIVEHWIYFSCDVLRWVGFDPNRNRLMQLPRMRFNLCFMHSDKESLAVGIELLVFGREITGLTMYKYSILTNSWLKGENINTPRCLFGSASLGEIAILAGGCDQQGNVVSSSELYNSYTGTWEILPDMNIARKMCSAVFMDGKYYVLGGIVVDNTSQLACVEMFDLKTKEWHIIPNMCPPRNRGYSVIGEAPPLIAVVKNVLYAADYAQHEVKRYNEDENSWVTIGNLPKRVNSINGWGMAFRSCGDKIVVVGGPSFHGGGVTEVNAWIIDEDEGAPHWNLLAMIQSGNFVHNCAVMGY